MATASDLLSLWLRRQLPAAASAWLDEQLAKLAARPLSDVTSTSRSASYRAGSAGPISTSPTADLAPPSGARAGWDPRGWSVDQAARILILLAAGGSGERFATRFMQLCRTADVVEPIAFYRGLPLYPDPERLEAQRGRGHPLRHAPVFEAVAHRNPYPCEQFSENRWNHMVLKALFVGSHAGARSRAWTSAPIRPLHAHALRLRARALGGRPAGQPGAVALRWRRSPTPRRWPICSACSRPAPRSSARPRRWRSPRARQPAPSELLAGAPDLAAAVERTC